MTLKLFFKVMKKNSSKVLNYYSLVCFHKKKKKSFFCFNWDNVKKVEDKFNTQIDLFSSATLFYGFTL